MLYFLRTTLGMGSAAFVSLVLTQVVTVTAASASEADDQSTKLNCSLSSVRCLLSPDNLHPPSPQTLQSRTKAQVTSVSELSDVKPTDWAFQAVQSLVERYGCIEGYSNLFGISSPLLAA